METTITNNAFPRTPLPSIATDQRANHPPSITENDMVIIYKTDQQQVPNKQPPTSDETTTINQDLEAIASKYNKKSTTTPYRIGVSIDISDTNHPLSNGEVATTNTTDNASEKMLANQSIKLHQINQSIEITQVTMDIPPSLNENTATISQDVKAIDQKYNKGKTETFILHSQDDTTQMVGNIADGINNADIIKYDNNNDEQKTSSETETSDEQKTSSETKTSDGQKTSSETKTSDGHGNSNSSKKSCPKKPDFCIIL